MSDQERLNLLKEVAGTKVYEQKRAESTRIMEDTGGLILSLVLACTYDAQMRNERRFLTFCRPSRRD